jgi:hypothetical protein
MRNETKIRVAQLVVSLVAGGIVGLIMIQLHIGQSSYLMGIPGAVTAFLLSFFLSRNAKVEPTQSVAKESAVGIAHVYVNNIEVGALPASQYREICTRSRKTWQLYVLQVLNMIKVVLRMSFTAFRDIPWLYFFLAALGVVCLADSEWQGIIDAVRGLSLSEALGYARKALLYGWTFNMFAHLTEILLTSSASRYGFTNHLDAAIGQELRRILEVPAEGDVMVIVINDEGTTANE